MTFSLKYLGLKCNFLRCQDAIFFFAPLQGQDLQFRGLKIFAKPWKNFSSPVLKQKGVSLSRILNILILDSTLGTMPLKKK